ncbi:hypothetical protein [Bradyrhizobium sp. AZCC 2289]|uniref:hypothetical protein n=1 Tax=Bradyrhizobium sp. AZCC 2289 TaxID=3117026 RepID=UPI002FEEC0A5
MSHLFLAKQLDGYAATFVRFTGANNFVVEVNGKERTVTREFWCSLSEMKADERSAGHHFLHHRWQRG